MHCIGNTYIYICMYIYNGYKNLSTYLSYTAGFLQAQELSDLLKPLKMVQLHLPGFQNFALPKNVYMWKALANQQWSCRHTHTNISTLFKIYRFLKIDPRVYLSNLHYRGIHIEEIHWVPDLIISKGNNEAKATKQQQVLASYIQYVSIYIVLAIHIYMYIYIYL